MSNLFPRRAAAVFASAAGALLLVSSPAEAQLRVATWNISNYNGDATRTEALKTAVFGEYFGRSMQPDVFMGQEFTSQTAVDTFLNILNTDPKNPGGWAAAPFVNGVDTDSAFFYRKNKVTFRGLETVVTGDVTPDTENPPRNVMRYDVSLKGYAGAAPNLALYSVHMKAGDSSLDQTRRGNEATEIRKDAASLPAGTQYLVGGDFNVDRSGDQGFSRLTSTTSDAGRFVDPINTPGTWYNNSAMRYVHTQDPSGTGGMDDRYDFVLLGTGLTDKKGFDYIGDATAAYSTITWNDPKHSYRAWGNDGTRFNQTIRVNEGGIENEMVGATIAQALKTASTGAGGHLPIFLDLRTPAELAASTAAIDFGTVQLGEEYAMSFSVFNGVDAGIWSAAGVAELAYAMELLGADDFAIQAGQFTDAAGGSVNNHLVGLDASTLGLKTATINLFADSSLVHSITLQANVVPEPAGIALIGFAAMGLLSRRRRGGQ